MFSYIVTNFKENLYSVYNYFKICGRVITLSKSSLGHAFTNHVLKARPKFHNEHSNFLLSKNPLKTPKGPNYLKYKGLIIFLLNYQFCKTIKQGKSISVKVAFRV